MLPFVLHLLDDFLLIDLPDDHTSILDILREIFSNMGVPLLPLYHPRILGILLDSIKMQASLLKKKLDKIGSIFRFFLSSYTVLKCELLFLLSHFNFAMHIFPLGVSFIFHLLTVFDRSFLLIGMAFLSFTTMPLNPLPPLIYLCMLLPPQVLDLYPMAMALRTLARIIQVPCPRVCLDCPS